MAKVLIVDDVAITRHLLKFFIEKMSHEVVGMAGNRDEAVKLFKERMPDLVTMDISLCESDGIAAVSDIKKVDPYAKVIIITAYDLEIKRKEILKLNIAGYIKKPFSKEEIENVIKGVIRPGKVEG